MGIIGIFGVPGLSCAVAELGFGQNIDVLRPKKNASLIEAWILSFCGFYVAIWST